MLCAPHGSVSAGSRLATGPDPYTSWPLALGLKAVLYTIGRSTPAKPAGVSCEQRDVRCPSGRGQPLGRRDACKTAAMNSGPDALHSHEPPLGAIPAGDAGLGPISPELALVDPVLALRARELLPEPRERARPKPPPAPLPASEPAARPEVRRRRWPRMLVLASVIFAAGAASGTFLGNHQTVSPAPRLEVRAVAPTTPQTTVRPRVLRPPKVLRPRTVAAARPQRRRRTRVSWASNVLGVEANVTRRSVALLWQQPADSARVVVLRRRQGRPSTTVVYRGQAAGIRDSALRPCTGYLYTIVNYDRRGHRSTGVPTSIVTRCA